MSDINQQKDVYRKKYLEFLDSINDGTLDDDITYAKQNYDALKVNDRNAIVEQIQVWETSPIRNGPEAQVKEQTRKKILKDIVARLGVPTSVKDAASKLKSNAIKKIKQAIPSPGVVIGRVFNPRRPKNGAKIFPENFNKVNKEITIASWNVSELYQEDNGRKHLIVFHIENNNRALVFRMANFTGFTDSITPTFLDKKYIGRAEPYYQYNGVTRNVSFSFDLVVHNREDVSSIYNKLNTLISLAYPFNYTDTKMIEPNIVKLSVAEYIVKKPLFLTGIQITPSDEVTFQNSKPSILTVNVQGNLLQNEEYPIFESQQDTSYVNDRVRSKGVRKLERPTYDFGRNIVDISSVSRAGGVGSVEVESSQVVSIEQGSVDAFRNR